jgi:hypothetical protein
MPHETRLALSLAQASLKGHLTRLLSPPAQRSETGRLDPQRLVLNGEWQKDLQPLVGYLQVAIGSGYISIVCNGRQPCGVDGKVYIVALTDRYPKTDRLTLPGVEKVYGTTIANQQT